MNVGARSFSCPMCPLVRKRKVRNEVGCVVAACIVFNFVFVSFLSFEVA